MLSSGEMNPPWPLENRATSGGGDSVPSTINTLFARKSCLKGRRVTCFSKWASCDWPTF